MAEWTPEATEYLEGYLKQVHALAKQSGEDGDEIASGLRDHIVEKTEEESGSLVTLDLLRRTLSEVGSPEAIVEEGTTWSSRYSAATHTEFPAASVPPVQVQFTPPPVQQVQNPPQRSGMSRMLTCVVIVAILVIITPIALSILGILLSIGVPALSRARFNARSETALAVMRTIHKAERAYFAQKHDADGDEMPDMADLDTLLSEGLVDKAALESAAPFRFEVSFLPRNPQLPLDFLIIASDPETQIKIVMDENADVQTQKMSPDEVATAKGLAPEYIP